MSDVPAESQAEADALAALRKDADLAVAAAKAMLASPVFERQIPLALLAKFATDETIPVRERRRSSEVLAHLQIKLIELAAHVTGSREQRMKDLGVEAAPQSVNVTQVNQRIEIVREGAPDWRALTGD